MSSVLLTVKTDAQTKQAVKEFASELGVSTTALVNIVLRQTLRDKKIVLSAELKPSSHLKQLIHEAELDYNDNRNITSTKSTKEALAHLNSLTNK